MLASAMEATGSRYIGESGAVKYIGSELKLLDRKKVYILGGKRALEAALPKMEEALKEEKLDYRVGEFSGYCTYDNAGRHACELVTAGCDSIVGVGGGKCMDTAKIISKLCNVPLGMVPTQLGTCVSCTNMAIVYENSGAYLEAYHPDKAIAFILADFELLAKSPVRYTASGIVDAMAKFPELNFTQRGSYDCTQTDDAASQAAQAIAGCTWKLYLANARRAYKDNKEKKASSSFTAIANTSLITTGVISGLARGSKQLAIAHSLYNNSTTVYPEVWRNYLHGEIVSVGVVLQEYFNRAPQEELEDYISIAKDLGAPVCLRDLGLEGSQKELDDMHRAIVKDFEQFDETDSKRLRELMERLVSL